MAKKNKTKYALLGMLSMSPMSGYDIKKLTDFSISHFWSENFGHIYPVLKKMEADGFVTKEVEETSGKPNRNIYSITPKGRQELVNWLHLPVEPPPIRNELLLKIFFADQLPTEKIIEMVVKERKKCLDNLSKYKKIEETLKMDEQYMNDKRVPFWLMTLSFGVHSSKAGVSWCEETLKILEERLENNNQKEN